MKKDLKNIVEEILDLPPAERAIIVDSILRSLDQPDKKIDDVWKEEVERRIKAYEAGKAKTVDFEDVVDKHHEKRI